MNNRLRSIAFAAFCLLNFFSLAQTAVIEGHIKSGDSPVPFATVVVENSELGTVADVNGGFEIKSVPAGSFLVEVSAVGYIKNSFRVAITPNEVKHVHFNLQEDVFKLSQAVVTGSRSPVERHNTPVIVNTIDAKIFETTQSTSVSQGLSYSPGIRVENNCQNCGFTQVRMNGLAGAYSQILINSRPIFSALAGVYGLEMLPSSMVDRIEIVRGGGSVMFGGNAIAGTVNIITKDPSENSFELGLNHSLIGGEANDLAVNLNGSIVSQDLNQGISFYGLNRRTEHYDANDDGFSEIVELNNNTLGFDAFYNVNAFNKFKLSGYAISEYRRGGSQFDLFPHQTDLTEQLEHQIVSASASYLHASKDDKKSLQVYGSVQKVDRDSYYGGGGRVLAEGDSLTQEDILALNAYGVSNDVSTVSGMQYDIELNPSLRLTAGSEYIYNYVKDAMPGYGRYISQRVGTWGTFAELHYKPLEKLTVQAGGRYDQLYINGVYDLDNVNLEPYENEQSLRVFVPRFTAMYSLKKNMKLRASLAQGYRGPQAFDEDLHLETVGGAVRFIRLDNTLEVERSNSVVLSLNIDKFTDTKQMNFVVEGFYTDLNNPFILSDAEELDNGVSVVTKRNGEGATISGVNLEANVAITNKWVVQAGGTLQQALYDVEEVVWSSEETGETISTSRLLRTPNAYGFGSVVYSPTQDFSVAYSGVITGTMDVAHVVDPETEMTLIKSTPAFFEQNIKLSYSVATGDDKIEFSAGVKNLLNSYQQDFDLGADRDAGYVYGPLRPRTLFVGVKFGLK